ncbi:MAG: urease accessory protein UreD [Steroidobacteraceae bacterium]
MSSLPQPVRGWQARLALRFEAGGTRTTLTRREHAGPLLVQRPFYPEGAPCHVYLIHPPGGVASGDELSLEVETGAAAHALLTTPAAAKFYCCGPAGRALVQQRLRVEGGVLEWLPQENIFYPDAAVELATVATVAEGARFIGWEIGCVGLPANALDLQQGMLRLRFELWRRQQPLLLDRLNVRHQVLAARWGLGGHAAFGTALAYPATECELQCARAALAEADGSAGGDCADLLLACTLVDGVLVCRATARRTDRLRAAFVRWWQAVRPGLLGREAVAPRIWST